MMMKRDYIKPMAKDEPAILWRDLNDVCRRVHHHLYETSNTAAARRYRGRLERMLTRLPKNDVAILREEALSLLHELTDNLALAIEHRERELSLIERLHASVQESIDAGRYDKETAASILTDWDRVALEKRRAILRDLKVEAQRAV